MMDIIEYQLASNSDRRISREEFEAAFDVLCSKKQKWKKYPLVTDILLSYPYCFKKEHAIVIIYFLQTVAAGRFTFNIKFQEYINFTRRERNNKYKLNKKTKSNKFISVPFIAVSNLSFTLLKLISPPITIAVLP